MSIALIILAAIFKAISDTLAHHFHSSVFRSMNPKWWDPAISWKYVGFLPLTKYRLDAWHLSNTLMIVSFVAAVAVHHNQLHWGWEILIGGTLFNLVFNLFYNKLLR